MERLESVLWGDETRRKEVEEADGGMREAGGAPVPRWAQSFAKFVFACFVVKIKGVVHCVLTVFPRRLDLRKSKINTLLFARVATIKKDRRHVCRAKVVFFLMFRIFFQSPDPRPARHRDGRPAREEGDGRAGNLNGKTMCSTQV